MSPAGSSIGSERLLSWARRHASRNPEHIARRAMWMDRFRDWHDRFREARSNFAQSVTRDARDGWTPHEPTLLERNLPYACNICGTANEAALGTLDRESPSCRRCGSTVRLRSMIDLLSRALFGSSLPISRFPHGTDKCGIGVSDAPIYASRLARKLAYVNTFYHQQPRLDICVPDPGLQGSCDFVIATDVLEHVVPPVDLAFKGVFSLLRDAGVFVGSVPYSLKDEPTIEHYPQLHEFRISSESGTQRLYNRRRDGIEETFDQLVFHGGEGATLEMRLFSRTSLMAQLEAAGFTRVEFCDQDVYEWGIVWLHPWSLPFVAFK